MGDHHRQRLDLIHSIRIEFVPTIVAGIANDVRYALAIQTITTTGTGGSTITHRLRTRATRLPH